MALEGNLKDISLTSVVQVMCIERRKAGLFVRRRGEEGAIFFDNGEIVHATVGRLEGEEAVYQLLTWTEGTFRTNDQISIPTKTVGMNWNHLLIEGMRRIDEGRENKITFVPPDKLTLSQGEVEQDSTLENDLILLLSKLEHLISKLRESKVQKRPANALEILADLVNQIIIFSEGVSKVNTVESSLVKALIRASDIYPQARFLQAEYNRVSVQTVINLYGSWAGSPADRRYMFRQISHSLINITEYYFSLFMNNFRSPLMRDQWKETYGVFVFDLTRAVDQVQF